MKLDLNRLTVFNDIRERLAAITPAQVEWANRNLTEPARSEAEKVIGTVKDPETIGLWVLACILVQDAQLELAKSRCALETFIEEDHKRQHALLDMLADAARALFWAQAKQDLGFFKYSGVTLRKDFTLVEMDASEQRASSLFRGMFDAGPR